MKFRLLLTSLILFSVSAFGQGTLTTEQIYQEAYENFVKRDYTSASASLDKINPVDQKKPDILNLRGAIYKRLGELDNAANAYSDALKVNPKDWVPKYNLAEVNFLREQYKSSRTFLEQALASMPESDRLQKQDLILYKVYLTYLLQGEEEKAKLLLDSFDINSANPVYYFAQAAWSYKRKDVDKAKTWVDSTDGLYSQDLRNSYSQSLVDVGWLEPVATAGTIVTASPTPVPTEEPVIAAASPAPTVENTAEIVPLSTNNATPIAVAIASTTPVPTPELTSTSTPDSVPTTADMGMEDPKPKPTEFWKILLPVVLVLGLAAIILMNLAKRSRMVPAPVDNTGYAAIAASSNPVESDLSSHRSEGTGVVRVQEPHDAPAAAPIKVTPIHREYAADQEAAAEKEAAASAAAAAQGPRTTRGIQTSAPARKPASKPASKPAAASRTSKPASAPKTATPKTSASGASSSRAGKAAAGATSLAASTGGKSTKAAPAKPATTQTQPVLTEKAPAKSAKPASKAASTVGPAPAAETVAPVASPKKAAPVKLTTTTAPATEGSPTPKRTRLIPVPTVDVPLTDEVKKTRVLVSNIGKIVVPAGAPLTSIGETSEPAASAPASIAPKKASPVKKPASRTVPAPSLSNEPGSKPKAAAPLITIPEFEEADSEPQTRTVLRVLPNQSDDSGNPPTGV